jgi:response regulator RpfG family c-di-GMP phosphodiesterase
MKHDKEGITILIVDDNLAIRAISKTFLENAGYTVITATDGEEGLRFFLQRQSSISLVLTEVMMPNMNGFDLAESCSGIRLAVAGSLYVRQCAECQPGFWLCAEAIQRSPTDRQSR